MSVESFLESRKKFNFSNNIHNIFHYLSWQPISHFIALFAHKYFLTYSQVGQSYDCMSADELKTYERIMSYSTFPHMKAKTRSAWVWHHKCALLELDVLHANCKCKIVSLQVFEQCLQVLRKKNTLCNKDDFAGICRKKTFYPNKEKQHNVSTTCTISFLFPRSYTKTFNVPAVFLTEFCFKHLRLFRLCSIEYVFYALMTVDSVNQ